jgi:hypothetical protein
MARTRKFLPVALADHPLQRGQMLIEAVERMA